MSDLNQNLIDVRERMAEAARLANRNPQEIRLIAVSKRATVDEIKNLIAAGQREFGENRLPDGTKKIQGLDSNLYWHMIGRIQTNKIKYLPQFHLIHSLDRWPLAVALNKYALNNSLRFKCLLQVNIAHDPDKAGIHPQDLSDFIEGMEEFRGIEVQGLMTIAAQDADDSQTLEWYNKLANHFATAGGKKLPENVQMRWLSMGMSNDFELAIKAGANIIRVGSAIFF